MMSPLARLSFGPVQSDGCPVPLLLRATELLRDLGELQPAVTDFDRQHPAALPPALRIAARTWGQSRRRRRRRAGLNRAATPSPASAV
jgi:hypothetical protein